MTQHGPTEAPLPHTWLHIHETYSLSLSFYKNTTVMIKTVLSLRVAKIFENRKYYFTVFCCYKSILRIDNLSKSIVSAIIQEHHGNSWWSLSTTYPAVEDRSAGEGQAYFSNSYFQNDSPAPSLTTSVHSWTREDTWKAQQPECVEAMSSRTP